MVEALSAYCYFDISLHLGSKQLNQHFIYASLPQMLSQFAYIHLIQCGSKVYPPTQHSSDNWRRLSVSILLVHPHRKQYCLMLLV